ncbi:VOC family protein [soil metagenome]
MITQLKMAGIPVENAERAMAFYTEQLGFSIATDQVMPDGKRWIELRIGRSPTRLVLFTPEGHEDRIGSFFNGSFDCDDVEATHRQLTARGVTFVEGPVRQPWGAYAKLQDSEGNTLVISSR